MANSHKNKTFYSVIFLLTVAIFSACGGSSSSSSSSIPDYSTVYYVHNLVFKNGTTLSTGYNAFGQLGTGNLDQRSVMGTLSQYYPFKGFATGGNHSVAFINNSTVRSWGYNYTGQLGNNTTTYSSEPVKTIGISGVKAVAAGAFHSLALTGDGTLWGWGWNNYGQLGYSTDAGYSVLPQRINRAIFLNDSTHVSAVSANGYNSMALSNGKVWAWGLNGNGQLGYNSDVISGSQIPLPVIDLPAGITGIASGSAFSYAVDVDGKVWAWGNNSNSQLGNGTVMVGSNIPSKCKTADIPTFTPVKVMTSSTDELTGVLQVAAGFHHGLARLDDGSVWAWGSNLLGQLGTGFDVVTGDSCYAFKVALPMDAIDIRAFGSSSMAQTEDGAWYAWGFNLYGQLGLGSDGYNSSVLTPVKMSGF